MDFVTRVSRKTGPVIVIFFGPIAITRVSCGDLLPWAEHRSFIDTILPQSYT
jgi:hypothetical protein